MTLLSVNRSSAIVGAAAAIVLVASIGDAATPTDTAQQIDTIIRQLPENENAEFAPGVDDDAFLRRAWLDSVGVIPSVEQLHAFRQQTSPTKRQQLVEQLTEDKRFGKNLARYWRDTILARRLEDRSMRVADPLVQDLAEWINRGDGWDEIATRFITATGKINEDGATAIIMAQDGRTEEIAAEVSRLFLGVQIQCAQCHDHPWDQWKREEFHELAAFFPRVGARPVRGKPPRTFEVVVNDRPDNKRFRKAANINRRGRPEHYMADLEEPDEPGKRMTPRFFLTGFEKPIGATDEARRLGLAEELVNNDWFTRAIVNRVWTELVGEGFYGSVDDIGPDRSVVAEEAMQALTNGFIESGHRLRWLYRTVMQTEAYARESRSIDRPNAGAMTASVAQPLRPEPLFDSLMVVLASDKPRTNPKQRQRFRKQALRAVNDTFGFDPSEPREDVVGTIPQSLMLMNSPALAGRMRANPGSMLAGLLETHTTGDGQVEHESVIVTLFERTLTRPPTTDEMRAAKQHVSATRRFEPAYEDLLWSLVNTAEFNHRR